MEEATGLARVARGTGILPFVTVKEGAISGDCCVLFCAIFEPPLVSVATATGFSAGAGFSGALVLWSALAADFLFSLSETGLLEAAGAGMLAAVLGAAGLPAAPLPCTG